MKKENNPDYLKTLSEIHEADPRQGAFSVFDEDINNFRSKQFKDHYESICNIKLGNQVPEKIIIHFETAKNIYLYAWFAFRLFPVSEQHALICTEYALRDRFGKELPKKYWNKKYPPTLSPLLRYAIDSGKIKNEHFEIWHKAAEQKAIYRYEREKIEEMNKLGLNGIEMNYSEIEVIDTDRKWNYLKILRESLPKVRNMYSHGASTLHNQVLQSFVIAKEIINQIYLPE